MQAPRAPHLPGLPALKGVCCDISPAVEEHCMTSVAPYMAIGPCHWQHHGSSYLQPVSNRPQLICLVLLHLVEWPLPTSLLPPFVHQTRSGLWFTSHGVGKSGAPHRQPQPMLSSLLRDVMVDISSP